MHEAWARYPKLSITCDVLENQTATMEQSSDEQLFRLEIELVRFVSNRSVRGAFIADQQSLFQVQTSVLCDEFGAAHSFKVHIVNNLARWRFARETLGTNSIFIIVVVELWRAMVSA